MPAELPAPNTNSPSLREIFIVWWRIGWLSFGGPAGQIALIQREVVETRAWMDEKSYLNALNFCLLLPGPEAMQLATYIGWKNHGVWGGLISGLLFVLPGAFTVAVLAAIYAYFGRVFWIDALFVGIQAAVIVIVIEALLRLSQRALKQPSHWLIAGLSFVAIFFFAVPFPVLIVLAALWGFWFLAAPAEPTSASLRSTGLMRSSLITALVWLVIWWGPILALLPFTGTAFLFEIGLFFSKLAVVTFGGAYAVLAYLAQDVVTHYGWLSTAEMMHGLGLAETTPGPLILVNEFVGFLAAYRENGWAYGLAGATVSLWATFVPCFLWIFVGAPWLEWISSRKRLRGSLFAISAAVVGVILNLSIWFALHALFTEVQRQQAGPLTLWLPQLSSVNGIAVTLTLLCGLFLLKLHWSVWRVLLLAALMSLGFDRLI